MKTALLLLEGPLQSWGGSSSRTESRHTGSVPTFSGVIGLISAAMGRRRDEDVLSGLDFAVRVDRPGTTIRDYQTKESAPLHIQMERSGKKKMLQAVRVGSRSGDLGYGETKLMEKTYLSGARFMAAVTGEDDLIEEIAAAFRAPKFHLYLGRKSCPPGSPVLFRVVESEDPTEALREQWMEQDEGDLSIHRTATGDRYEYRSADVASSFDSAWRKFSTRRVEVIRESRVRDSGDTDSLELELT